MAAAASGRFGSAKSINRRSAAARSVKQASSALSGGGSPSAMASPRGLGTQNRAGRTKANSSSTSKAASASAPSPRAVARQWQTIGMAPSRAGVTSSGASVSNAPSASSIVARPCWTTRVGAAGSAIRGGSEWVVLGIGVSYVPACDANGNRRNDSRPAIPRPRCPRLAVRGGAQRAETAERQGAGKGFCTV